MNNNGVAMSWLHFPGVLDQVDLRASTTSNIYIYIWVGVKKEILYTRHVIRQWFLLVNV